MKLSGNFRCLSQPMKIRILFCLKTDKELASIAYAKTMVNEAKSTITVERLENGVNTPYSEVGAIIYKKGMMYSSKQFEEVNKK